MHGIYLVTSQGMYERFQLEWSVIEAVKAGVKYVQLRENQLPSGELYKLAKSLKNQLAQYSVPLIIHDRADIALAIGAAGVHLEKNDMPWQVARQLLGDGAIIGVSIHNRLELEKAQEWEVNYLACGPVFPTQSKAYSHQEWGIERIGLAAKDSHIPVVAVGGINPENIGQVTRSGVGCVAVVSAILNQPQPKQAALSLVQAFEK
jgi:thiamine-phosphate pyrophosphorylase